MFQVFWLKLSSQHNIVISMSDVLKTTISLVTIIVMDLQFDVFLDRICQIFCWQ